MTPRPEESPKPGFTSTDSLDAVHVFIDVPEKLIFRPRPKPPVANPDGDSNPAEGDKSAK